MPEIAYTLPFMLISDTDLQMADECFKSLSTGNADGILVLYNQGPLSNKQLEIFLSKYPIENVILGNGENIGIPAARQACFKYIWNNLPEVLFVSEIHVDMIFTSDWVKVLTQWLKSNDEPMIAPGILTAFGELHPEQKGIKSIEIPSDYSSILALLPLLTTDSLAEGLVHPVIHKAETLKAIGGYDTRFLTGQQGFEDDSLLLGYRFYMGVRNNWKPKACLKTRVFHKSLAQRVYLQNMQSECAKNLEGLIKQYGVYGLEQLDRMHCNKTFEATVQDKLGVST